MNRACLRNAHRLRTIGIVPGVYIGSQLFARAAPIRLDALQSSASPSVSAQHGMGQRRMLSSEVVKQLSRGSVAGFCVGTVLAVFSKTLALLGGVLALTLHLGSRYGIDLPRILKLKKLSESSASMFWARTVKNPYFSASFAFTAFLAAFAHL